MRRVLIVANLLGLIATLIIPALAVRAFGWWFVAPAVIIGIVLAAECGHNLIDLDTNNDPKETNHHD